MLSFLRRKQDVNLFGCYVCHYCNGSLITKYKGMSRQEAIDRAEHITRHDTGGCSVAFAYDAYGEKING